MKPTIENIIDFIADHTGIDRLNENTDILNAGCYGDDWHELMESYSKEFSVNMSNYLWYFHTPEEGCNLIGGMFFKSPDQRVERIIITPKDLLNMAVIRKWNIDYPEHTIPRKRHDLTINSIILVAIIIGLIVSWLF